EEEDEEARALLAGGPGEADRGAPATPGALPALCDPSRLAHRLLAAIFAMIILLPFRLKLNEICK
ncbi:MFSD1 isoform 12, partial [Pongo abelii]